MLIALLSDIHANREALSACLAHAEQQGAQRYILLGDYVGYGADPAWVLDRVMELVDQGAVALLGNHDEAVFASSRHMNRYARVAIEWTRGMLGRSHREFLRALPLSQEENGRLFVHASAADPRAWTYVTDAYAAALSFSASPRRQIYCGHVHVPALYCLSDDKLLEFVPAIGTGMFLGGARRWLAVLGSVGQPRDGDPAACYALLDDAKDMLTYVRLPYDVASAARKIRAVGLPDFLASRLEQGL